MMPETTSEATPETPQALEARIRRKLVRQHFMHHIGANLTRIEPGRIEAELVMEQQHQQHTGFAHGGLVATMADLVAGFAAVTLVPEGTGVVTVELKTQLPAPRRGPAPAGRGLGAQSRPPPALLRVGSMVRRQADCQSHGHDGRD